MCMYMNLIEFIYIYIQFIYKYIYIVYIFLIHIYIYIYIHVYAMYALCIQPHLRKCDWGMIRGLSTFSDSACIHRDIYTICIDMYR